MNYYDVCGVQTVQSNKIFSPTGYKFIFDGGDSECDSEWIHRPDLNVMQVEGNMIHFYRREAAEVRQLGVINPISYPIDKYVLSIHVDKISIIGSITESKEDQKPEEKNHSDVPRLAEIPKHFADVLLN